MRCGLLTPTNQDVMHQVQDRKILAILKMGLGSGSPNQLVLERPCTNAFWQTDQKICIFLKKGFLISILNPSSSPSMLSNRSLREPQAWELERWQRDSEPLLPLQRIKFSSCKSVQSLKLQFPGIWCPLLGFTGSTCKHTVHLYTHR